MWRGIYIAWDSVERHMATTAMACWGMCIGVGSVILVAAIGLSAHTRIDNQLASVGRNLILVKPGGQNNAGIVTQHGDLRDNDVEALRKDEVLCGVVAAIAEAQGTIMPVSAPTGCRHVTCVVGHVPALQTARGWELAAGRFLVDNDLRLGTRVCVLGETVRERLFGASSPLGQKVRVGNTLFSVVGVLRPKGQALNGYNQDDELIVPLTTFRATVSVTVPHVDVIVLTTRRAGDYENTVARIGTVLRAHRLLKTDQPNDFEVVGLRSLVDLGSTLNDTFQRLTIGVASIAIIVGGVGVAGTFLAGVRERTGEIGLRLAVGASPMGVFWQFLSEAVGVTMLGGGGGAVGGLAIAFVVTTAFGWPFILPAVYAAMALLVIVLVGICAGAYPAWTASRTDPICALRHL